MENYLTNKSITGPPEFIEEPTMPEEEFDNQVDQMFKKVKKILLGTDKEGKKWYLEYDFAAVAWDPFSGMWRIASVFFIAEDQDGEIKFSFWRQPKLAPYLSEKFSAKMEKWIRKKYKLEKFNSNQVAAKIMKVIESIENKANSK